MRGSQEVNFELNELFFSKTDLKGIIQSGNSVFVRVSEYSKEELLHRPHNLIRHPDMPRSVFKLFWDFLKDGKPIAAYVKNKSKTGKYYWVFAMAFPMSDGYLSIRLKPSSKLFTQVKLLYTNTIFHETQRDSMEDGLTFIQENLKNLGFHSYQEFMQQALLEELTSRDHLLNLDQPATTEQKTEFSRDPSQILSGISRKCTATIRQSFTSTRELFERTHDLVRESQAILKTCNDVKFVTVNLTISSAKLGDAGRPLSVVSSNLEKLTQDISVCSKQFEEVFEIYQKSVLDMYFSMGISRFQIEMMNHLTTENADNSSGENSADSAQAYLFFNCNLLKNLVAENFKKVLATSAELMRINKNLLGSIDSLAKITNGMGVIHVVGKIEMARTGVSSESLISRLQEMETLTETFRKTLKNLETQCLQGLSLCEDFETQAKVITSDLDQISRLIAV